MDELLYVAGKVLIHFEISVSDAIILRTGLGIKKVRSSEAAIKSIEADRLAGVFIHDLAVPYMDFQAMHDEKSELEIPKRYHLSSEALTKIYYRGLEVVNSAHQKGLSVVVLSPRTEKIVEEKARELGASKFLEMPQALEEIAGICYSIFLGED